MNNQGSNVANNQTVNMNMQAANPQTPTAPSSNTPKGPTANNIQTDFSDANNNKQTVKMKRFKYKIKDATGKIIESYFDAESKVDVEAFLLNRGYEVVSIEEDKLSTSLGLAASAN